MDLHTLAVSIVNLLSVMCGPVVYLIYRQMVFGTLVAKAGGAWIPKVTELVL